VIAPFPSIFSQRCHKIKKGRDFFTTLKTKRGRGLNARGPGFLWGVKLYASPPAGTTGLPAAAAAALGAAYAK
jgi:hypothetical protein